jgi:hypothetical protein
LRRQAGYVVIEAPSTTSSADAQSLASLADAAILAVELRRARRPALLDAAEQLRRVGTPLLGAVVLPRLAGLRTDDVTEPVVALTAPTVEKPILPSPEETAVIETDRTQPMRFPTNTVSRPAPRQNGNDSGDEPTAVIELSPSTTKTDGTDGKSDKQ